jgi:hypothetical protein
MGLSNFLCSIINHLLKNNSNYIIKMYGFKMFSLCKFSMLNDPTSTDTGTGTGTVFFGIRGIRNNQKCAAAAFDNKVHQSCCNKLSGIHCKKVEMVSIRQARADDLIQIQNSNLWCLPEK